MSFNYLLESDSLTREQLRKYNVSELQDILTQFNLDISGKKQELVERLFQFWCEIQSPSGKQMNSIEQNSEIPNCIKFHIPNINSVIEIRLKLEEFGEISSLLLDTEFDICYVSYTDTESTRNFYEECNKIGFEEPVFVNIEEIDKRAKEMNLIKEDTEQKFQKTTTEPVIYWCTGPGNM